MIYGMFFLNQLRFLSQSSKLFLIISGTLLVQYEVNEECDKLLLVRALHAQLRKKSSVKLETVFCLG